ncbi:fasciclin domain-containing protein [Chitinophaga niabensis]|uniref:fasciclin domain-containing protein n=1 Tax=Chitinophaga niabensis TaxID=536979 RepID=UPI0031BB5A07
MRTNHTFLFRLLLVVLPVLASCKHEQLEVYEENIRYRPGADFLKNNYDLSLFAAAVEKAGMMEELSGPGPFTILAPNNAAFHELGIQRPADFDKMNKDSLRLMVRYHILNRKLLTSDIPVMGVDVRYTTLAEGRQLYVSHENYYVGYYYFNGSIVEVRDVVITNGTLHVLGKVMKYEKGTVRDWLEKHKEYSLLVAAFKKYGFWDQLLQDGPFTIFAPDNDAFAADGMTLERLTQMDTSRYIGNRLFGVYIQRQRNIFISDFKVFRSNNAEYGLDAPVYGDSYYLNIGGDQTFPTRYSFQLRSKKDYPFMQLKLVAGKEYASFSDNLTDNGLIQPLTGLAVMPEEAKK